MKEQRFEIVMDSLIASLKALNEKVCRLDAKLVLVVKFQVGLVNY